MTSFFHCFKLLSLLALTNNRHLELDDTDNLDIVNPCHIRDMLNRSKVIGLVTFITLSSGCHREKTWLPDYLWISFSMCYLFHKWQCFFALSTFDIYKFLFNRSSSGKYVLPWIYSILVNHGHNIIAQESGPRLLDSLHKVSGIKVCFVIYMLICKLTFNSSHFIYNMKNSDLIILPLIPFCRFCYHSFVIDVSMMS